MPGDPVILFYDRDCRFCCWGVVAIARRSRQDGLVLATIQGTIGRRYLDHLGDERRLSSWHAWDGERLRNEADVLDALAPLVRTRWLRAAVAVARAVPRPLAAAVYRRVAAHRVGASRLVPDRWKRRSLAEVTRFSADPADTPPAWGAAE